MLPDGTSLEDLYNLGEKRICQVGDDQTENAASS